MLKRTYASELFLLLENASFEDKETWSLFYKNFAEKNKDFCKKYSKDLEKYVGQKKPNKWRTHLRMIRYWNDGSVTEMMTQINTLWDMFGLKKWIAVNEEGKTFSYPDELAKITKILKEGNNLVQNIFPEILNNLTSKHATRIKETGNFSGNIDWGKTINRNIRGGMVTPIRFVTKSHDKIFETAENKLGILALKILKNNIENILYNSKLQKEIPKESSIVSDLIHLNDHAENLLNDPRIYQIYKKYRNNNDKTMDTKKFKNLLDSVKKDIKKRKIKHNSQKSYKSLVNWIDAFPTEYNMEHILGDKDAKTLKVTFDKSIDIIYELWIVVSLVHVLSKHKVKLIDTIYNKETGLSEGYVLSYKKMKFELRHGKIFYYIDEEFEIKKRKINPDFVLISIDQKFVPIVMDAKNFLEKDERKTSEEEGRNSEAEDKLIRYRDILKSEGFKTDSTIGFFPRQNEPWVGGRKNAKIRLDPQNKKELEKNLNKFYVDILSKKITELEEYENSKK